MRQPKYELQDETGEAIRRFYSMEFAQKFLCDGYTIVKLDLFKPPHPFQQLLSLNLGDPPF